ncbi:hypothetical protein CANCADRAFT_82613 [Tortispora caseinolytica NRRL Y-17796]|uniref:GTP 3',8-cyclase n=1 Tax=Tortispora caseinolytica NRRL Y-17796 TaxID=767744 RepID=A0A1E4TK58_9ASCO|nr:hypothetical protein CANCADRAFT_82613 [Tortispora caseinolytica NRRL Y-17796]
MNVRRVSSSGHKWTFRPARRRLEWRRGIAQPAVEPVEKDKVLNSFAARRARIQNAKPFSEFLTDSFGRQHDYLRISISERCNLRCLYCMPEEGIDLTPSERLLTKDEIVTLAKLFVAEGVRKIRLTGGEPTVRKDVVELVEELGAIPGLQELCMTSNGIALHRKLPSMIAAGLTGLNISLDTLQEGKFMLLTRRNGLKAVLRSIDTALTHNIKSLKINNVVMAGQNEDEMTDFIDFTKDAPIEVRFIEYMPFDGNKWSEKKMFTYNEMLETLRSKYPDIRPLNHHHKPNEAERIPIGETARTWQIPGHQGRIGFITSMTKSFCGSCTRLRITADGNLKVCLFGPNEISLRDQLRAGASPDELRKVIGAAVQGKKASHAGVEELQATKNRPMILIGG